MKKPQFSKLQTAITLYDFLMENPEILNEIPNNETILNQVKTDIEQIQTHNKQQNETTYLSEQKEQSRLTLNEQMEFVSSKMVVYADDKNDAKLMSLVKYTPSEIKQYKESEIQLEANSLYELANTHLRELGPYKLNAETQEKFFGARTSYAKMIPNTDIERQSQKNLTSQLVQDFDKLSKTLDKLDLRVNMIKTEEPVFYSDYYALRKLHITHSSLALQAFITDTDTEAPIPNACVVFSKEGKVVLTKTTSEMGAFRVALLEPGIYSVTVSKIGYADMTLTVILPGDETYKLEVKMLKA